MRKKVLERLIRLGNANSGKKCLINLLSWTPYWLVSVLTVVLGRLGYWLHEKGHFKNYLPRALKRTLGVNQIEAAKILKANFVHMALILFEVAKLSRLKKDSANARQNLVETTGDQYFQTARDKKQGVILLSAHMGNFEWLISGFLLTARARADIPIYAIVWKQPDNFENLFLDSVRKRFGVQLLYSQEMNTQDAVGILNSGGIILILADYFTLGNNEIPFFGIPTHMAAGTIHYALKSNAPVIPVYTVRKGHRHQIIFEPPLEMPTEGDIYGKGLERIVMIYERWIKSRPEQYFWFLWRNDWGKPDLKK